MGAIRTDWTLELGRRWKGRSAYVDAWAVEKLAKVAVAIAQARDLHVNAGPPEDGGELLDLEDALVEAWRNLAKLGAWQAGNTAAYDEGAVRAAFEEGQAAMLSSLEELLAPVLEGKAS